MGAGSVAGVHFEHPVLYPPQFDDIPWLELVASLVSPVPALQRADYEVCGVGGEVSVREIPGHVDEVFVLVLCALPFFFGK